MPVHIHPHYRRCLDLLNRRAARWTPEQTQQVLAAAEVRQADVQLNEALLSGEQDAIIAACNAFGQVIVRTGKSLGAEIGA